MKKIKYILTLVVLVLGCSALFSAPNPPPSGGPNCWPPPCVPIDGGLSFLIVAGAAYGARKIYKSSKKADTLS